MMCHSDIPDIMLLCAMPLIQVRTVYYQQYSCVILFAAAVFLGLYSLRLMTPVAVLVYPDCCFSTCDSIPW